PPPPPLGRRELWTELHQNRPELRAQLPRAIEEQRRKICRVTQPVLVRDLLWELEGERKVRGCPFGPAADRLRCWNRVEGRVDLDRDERARIDREKIRRPRLWRIER